MEKRTEGKTKTPNEDTNGKRSEEDKTNSTIPTYQPRDKSQEDNTNNLNELKYGEMSKT